MLRFSEAVNVKFVELYCSTRAYGIHLLYTEETRMLVEVILRRRK
jgi:hypothetical protein